MRGERSRPCTRLLDDGAWPRLQDLASRILPLAREVEDRWKRLLDVIWDAADLGDRRRAEMAASMVEALQALAAGDRARLVSATIRRGTRLRDLGMPIEDAVAAAGLFADACTEALADAGWPSADLLAARSLLDRLGHVRVSLLHCAYTRFFEAPAGPEARSKATTVRDQLCGMVGASPPMQRLYDRVLLASRAGDTVLVTGESGSGKELVARAIHALGRGADGPFVAVNCAAIPRDLVESELFGYRRGAFSGAVADHRGLVRAASGGTLLLDEVTELAPEAQAKLLRVLQERAVRPVGETREAPVSLRFVATTNRPLRDALAEGRLRRDLYYRLQRFVVEVPPLRARIEDIPLLVRHLVERWQRTCGSPEPRRFTEAALERLARHQWPGNVRELENAVFTACACASGPVVAPDDLPPLDDADALPAPEAFEAPVSLRQAERQAIEAAMERAGGNKSRAARLLGISRKQLYVKINGYGIGSGGLVMHRLDLGTRS